MTQAPELPASARGFSASDAVFSAFEFWRAQPGRFFAILALYLLASALIAAPWAVAAWRDLAQGIYPYGTEAAFRPSRAFLSLYGLAAVPVNAAALAALLRIMLPRRPRPSYAHDALMLLAIQIVVTLLAALLVALVLIVGLLLLALVFAVAGAAAQGAAGPPPVFAAGLGFYPVILIVLVFAPMIYLLLRLSLAPAMTVAEGRFRLFESWRATRGGGAALFGAHLLRFVLICMAWVFAAAVFGLIGLMALRPDLGATIAAFRTDSALPPRAMTTIATVGGLYALAARTIEFVSLAMGAGIGASFLRARRRLETADVSS